MKAKWINYLNDTNYQHLHKKKGQTMFQPCNPSNSGGRESEDHSSMSSLAKSSQDPISTNDSRQWHTSVIPAMKGSTNRRSPGRKQDSIAKITDAKRTSS
jgi:hypothetical protein